MILEIAKQVPALAVLCFVVYLFLGKLTFFMDVIKELNKEHIDARGQSREALKDNTTVMRENTVAMTHLVETIDRHFPPDQR